MELRPRVSTTKKLDATAPAYEFQSFDDGKPGGKVGVITVRRFAGGGDTVAQLKKLVTDYSEHRNHDILVFVFRDNYGGADTYIYDWANQAAAKAYVANAGFDVAGPHLPCFYPYNATVMMQIYEGTVDTEKAKAERAELTKSWPALPVPLHLSMEVETPSKTVGQHPFAGKVFSLVNASSYSAAETSALALQAAVGAIPVGERSGGAVERGNVSQIVLPRTKIRFNIPTREFSWGEVSLEGKGVPVAYYLSPELDDGASRKAGAHFSKAGCQGSRKRPAVGRTSGTIPARR